MLWTIPNILTMFRIGILPVLIILLYVQAPWATWTALGIYTVAAFTDFFDGYIARSMNSMSAFGRFLDPIADKLVVGAMLMMLAGFDRLPGLWLVPAIVILVREILITGMREFLGPYKITLPVSRLAKWKTTSQMIAMGFLIVGHLGDPIVPNTLLVGQIGLTIAAVLTVITGWSYMVTGIRFIRTLDKDSEPGK